MQTSLISSPTTSAKHFQPDQPQQLKSVTIYWRGRRMVLMQRPQRRLSALLCKMLRRSWANLFGTLTRTIGAGAMTAAALSAQAHGGLPANTLPTGYSAVGDTVATKWQNRNHLTIKQTSEDGIYDWQSFSIGSNAHVRFIQNDANAISLNRVLGNDPSIIMGSLTANGKIFLINAAGILVGKTGKIDVASFTASTLNITDADAFAGNMNFAADVGKTIGNVKNKGAITSADGGSVYLVGANVENDGIITSPNGQVLLAAGNSVQFVDTSLPGVTINVGGIDGKVTNLGQIIASAGTIGIGAGLIDNSGIINASSVDKEGGRIFLRAATQLTTDATSKIDADGTTGGTVQLYSDQVADIDGDVSALGSAGNGGYIDTSGKTSLSVQYVPRVGLGGEWYIDPYNITIVADSPPDPDVNATLIGGVIVSNGTGSTIHVGTINTALDAGAGVTISTGGIVSAGGDAGDITLDSGAQIVKNTGAASLFSLQAAHNIIISAGASITDNSSSGLSVQLYAGFNGSTAVGAIQSNGNITMGIGNLETQSTTFTNGGNLTLGSGPTTFSNDLVNTLNGTINVTGGTTQVAGIVTDAGAVNVTGGQLTMGGLGIGGVMLISGGSVTAGSTSISGSATVNGTGSLEFTSDLSGHGTLLIGGSGHATLDNDTSLTLDQVTQSGGIFDIKGNFTIGNLSISGGQINGAAGKSLTVTNGLAQTGGAIGGTGTSKLGSASFTQASGDLIVGNINVANGLSLTSSAGAISQNAGTSVTAGSLTAHAVHGIALANSGNIFSTSVAATNTLSGLLNINNDGTGSLSLGELENNGGDLTLTTGGGLIATSGFSANGTVNATTHGTMTIGANGIVGHNINLTSLSGGDIEINGVLSASTGTVTLNSANKITEVNTSTGGIVATSTTAIAANDIALNGVTHNNVGTFSANSSIGGVSLVNIGDLSVGGISAVGGNVELSSTGFIHQTSGAITTTHTLTASAGTGITLNSATNNVSAFVASNSGSGNIALTDATTTLTLNGSISNTAIGGGDGNGNVNITNSGDIVATAVHDGGGAINGIDTTLGAVSLTSETGSVTLGRVNTQNLYVSALQGAIQQEATGTGGLTVSNSMSANASAGITLANSFGTCGTNKIATFYGNNTVSGDIKLNSYGRGVTLASVTNHGGNITVNNNDLVDISGQIMASNTITINNIAGGIVEETSGGISAASLHASATDGILLGSGTNTVFGFVASNSTSGDIILKNTTSGTTGGTLTTGLIHNGGGNISIENTGAMVTTALIDAPVGAISLRTHSPLTIGAGVNANGNITAMAGDPAPNANSTDNLVVNGLMTSATGNVLAQANNVATINVAPTAPNGTRTIAGATIVLNVPVPGAITVPLSQPPDITPVNPIVNPPDPTPTPPITTNPITNTVDQSVVNTTNTDVSNTNAVTTAITTTTAQTQNSGTDQTTGGGTGEFGGSDTQDDKKGTPAKSSKPLPLCT